MELFEISDGHAGLMIWVIWGLVGVLCALLGNCFSSKRTLWLDAIAAVLFSLAGGFFSCHFLGDTTEQLMLVSLLGSAFGACLILWIISSWSRKY